MYKRLRWRLTMLCAAITGVILVGMAAVSLSIAQTRLTEKGEAAFRGSVNAILYHLRSQTILDHAWLSQMEAGNELLIQVISKGKVLSRAGGETPEYTLLFSQARELSAREYGLDLALPPESQIHTEQVYYQLTDFKGQNYVAASAVIPLDRGWAGVVVLHCTQREEQELALQQLLFGGCTLFGVVLLILFAWFFTARAVQGLEENNRKQLEFVSAASHELRSPLAAVRASLAALKDASPEQAEHFSTAADAECIRMSRLVNDMLLLASADAHGWTIHPEKTELETLLLDSCEAAELSAHKKNQKLSVHLPEAPLPQLECDRERIRQVLSILLDNAVYYTPPNGEICVDAKRCKGGVGFSVRDTGPGIPEEQKKRIFERFFRGDPSRSRKEHYGLGLCIAREVILLHHGSITVKDADGGGAEFVVFLPEAGFAAEKQNGNSTGVLHKDRSGKRREKA